MPNDKGPAGPSMRGDVLNLAAVSAHRYVHDVCERRVAPSEAAVSALAELWEPFPSSPSDPGEVITRLDRIGSAATVAMTGGRYFGFVNGGMVPAAMAANWLAVAWNQNAALRVMSPIAKPKRSEEHTSELQSHSDLVCRLLLEKKKKSSPITYRPTRY